MRALIVSLAALVIFTAGIITGNFLAHASLEKEVIELNRAFYGLKER